MLLPRKSEGGQKGGLKERSKINGFNSFTFLIISYIIFFSYSETNASELLESIEDVAMESFLCIFLAIIVTNKL